MSSNSEYMKKYSKTKSGLAAVIYQAQASKSKLRGMDAPTYSSKDLKAWLYSQVLFHTIYDNWKRLDFQSGYRPSIDRIDNSIGYTMANIQLMTWDENNAKADKDVIEGRLKRNTRPVVQYTLDGVLVSEYYSISEAARQTGIRISSISMCCKKKKHHATAGGFNWEYGGLR